MSKSLDFAAFFSAVHEVPPLPWQQRLAKQLCDGLGWPPLIDLPTASGKTACLDIALFHLAWVASQQDPAAPLPPRRIVFVVDRRIIVDAAHMRAERLCKALADADADPAIRTLAQALVKLGGTEPLQAHRLRGGMPRETGFATDPAQPMILSTTVDQVGSRLLFRGYGLSPYAQPIHAGLLAFDTLILLDEAHLSKAFTATVRSLRREQGRASPPPQRPAMVHLVPLSATATSAETDPQPFRLDASDRSNPTLARRASAPKPARLIPGGSNQAEQVKVLRREALALLESLRGVPAATLAIVVNRVALARRLFDALRETPKAAFDARLLTGRCRPLDREPLTEELMRRCAAGRQITDQAARPLIVVATQTIEVGADLDFHALLTECAALDALRQRFGRLDRLGEFRRAQGGVVGGVGGADPVYGDAALRTWEWLQAHADTDLQVDFSLDSQSGWAISPELLSPDRYRLPLTSHHVELLSQTSPRPTVEPDIAALLHGLDSAPADVQLVWRAQLPLTPNREDIDREEVKLTTRLLAMISPTSLEALALPLHQVRGWLEGHAQLSPLLADAGSQQTAGEERKPDPKITRHVWRWNGELAKAIRPNQIQPGDLLVLPVEYGGCDAFGFAPEDRGEVRDLSADARARLQRELIEVWSFSHPQFSALAQAWKDADEDPSALRDALRESAEPALHARADQRFELLRRAHGDLYAIAWREVKPRAADLSDEQDDAASLTVPVALTAHNLGVGDRAARIGFHVQLTEAQIADLRRAGHCHDLGKADPRFQRLLRGDATDLPAGLLLAKGMRARGGAAPALSLGERHEAYSVAMLRQHPALLSACHDPELVLWLVGVHHGRGRALMPDPDDPGTRFIVTIDDQPWTFDGTPELGALSAGWPDLFWRLQRRYGPWRLAYLEAVLRLADHQQSRAELERGSGGPTEGNPP